MQPWKITAPSSDTAEKGSELTSKMVRGTLPISRLAEKIWTQHGSQGFEVGRRGALEQGNGEIATESPNRQCLLRAYESRWLLFSAERSEKSVFNPSVGTRLLLGHLESIYGIAYTASQLSVNLCPQMLFTEKKEFKSRGCLEWRSGRAWTACHVQLWDSEKWREAGIGEGKVPIKWRCVGRWAVRPRWRGNNASTGPSQKLISGWVSRGPRSPSCFFTCLCCPAQISDCCCSIQLFRNMHLDLAFAVAQMAPAQTGTNWAGASLSRCPSTPHAALTTFRRKTFHCIQNLFCRAGAIREPGQSQVHARSVAPGRPASPASKNAYLLGSRTACGPRVCRHQRKRGGCCSPSKLITRLTPLSPGHFSLWLWKKEG